MATDDTKTIARRFYEEVINKGDMRLAKQLIAADYIEHPRLPGVGSGLEGFKQFIGMVSTAFPDIYVAVEDVITEGDKAAVRLTIDGTHKGIFMGDFAPTGKHVTWTGIDIIRVADGKIIERWNERNLLGLMQQLGVVPE